MLLNLAFKVALIPFQTLVHFLSLTTILYLKEVTKEAPSSINYWKNSWRVHFSPLNTPSMLSMVFRHALDKKVTRQ